MLLSPTSSRFPSNIFSLGLRKVKRHRGVEEAEYWSEPEGTEVSPGGMVVLMIPYLIKLLWWLNEMIFIEHTAQLHIQPENSMFLSGTSYCRWSRLGMTSDGVLYNSPLPDDFVPLWANKSRLFLPSFAGGPPCHSYPGRVWERDSNEKLPPTHRTSTWAIISSCLPFFFFAWPHDSGSQVQALCSHNLEAIWT